MFGRRCTLCGGKLNGQGICTECGLDNTKSDKNYRLNQSDCDHMPLTHVHEHPEKPVKSRTMKKPKVKTTPQSYQTMGQSMGQSYSQPGENYGRPRKKGGCLKVFSIMLVVLMLVVGILIPLITTVKDKIMDYAYQQSDDYERSDPYEYVEKELPESGTAQTLELTSGEYIVGVHIPAGQYSVSSEYDYDTIQVSDDENGIYLYEYKGQEDNCLDDIRLYDGALVEIESKTKMTLKAENAQELTGGEQNQQTAETKIEGDKNYVVGSNFEAGVYDLEVTDGSGNLDISIKDKSGTEVTTIYMYLGEYSSYGKDYKNLVLPEGSTIKSEGDIQIKLTPSEKIVSDDYADYYEKY